MSDSCMWKLMQRNTSGSVSGSFWKIIRMHHISKYANRIFPFQKTLDNFYAQQYKDGFICREFTENTGIGRFSHYDPSSTGPNIMIWSEWSYFENFGDVESVKAVSDLMSPVTGVVCAVNEELLDAPEKLNEDPYGAWIIKVENVTAQEDLLDAASYEAFCQEG